MSVWLQSSKKENKCQLGEVMKKTKLDIKSCMKKPELDNGNGNGAYNMPT
jgi:hypothetical protein